MECINLMHNDIIIYVENLFDVRNKIHRTISKHSQVTNLTTITIVITTRRNVTTPKQR